ncbi:MAG TPA: ThuA domain-containing protein [Planctomycetia bacterium]|nr:ThuA domain-containing protein [Planctomycetia bacterium]
MKRSLSLAFLAMAAAPGLAADPLKVLLIDGQNNHNWKSTTPILKSELEGCGRFRVDVATSPPKETTGFRPRFSDYDAVVSNYNGRRWPKETEEDFVAYVKNGGGFVSVHAANNAFPDWPEYNRIIGVGGWGGRNEKSGPYVRVRDGKVVRETVKGNGGSHGRRHPFTIVALQPEHPIMAGLPKEWKHAEDELYDRLRGPAEDLEVLASAFADPKTGGSGQNEPMLMTVTYGKGRVFHTTLGHDTVAMKCPGFIVATQRGTEWAATGKVTLKAPTNLPN